MRVEQMSPAAAIASLGSRPSGLTRAEVELRLKEFGPNRVESVMQEPLWLPLVKEFTSNFSLILWFAAALAFFAEWRVPAQGMLKIGIAIVAVIVVSGLFSFCQEIRVERSLLALLALLPQQVNVMREGQIVRKQ